MTHNPVAIGFNSPGGNVPKAVEFSRLIRARGLNTIQPRGLECDSVCSLTFMGGVNRFAQLGAIGVHKSLFPGINEMNAAGAV